MPNWVINRIVLHGENAEQALKNHFTRGEDGELNLDFNTIEKMPKELQIEKGSRSIDGLRLAIAKRSPFESEIGISDEKLSPEKFIAFLYKTIGHNLTASPEKYLIKDDDIRELRKQYKNDFDEVLELGEKCLGNLQKYGCTDWYDWACEHWGSKWNACETQVVDDCVYFNTAWSPAIPAIEKLAKMHPELTIEHSFSEEQASLLCGRVKYERGQCVEKTLYPEFSKKAYELYFDLWGGEEYFRFDSKTGTYVYQNEENEME